MSGHNEGEDGLGKAMRSLLIVAGMFTPVIVGSLVGHGHDAVESAH